MITNPFMYALEFLVVGKRVTKFCQWHDLHSHGAMLFLDNDTKLYLFGEKTAYVHMNKFSAPDAFISRIHMYGYRPHEDGDTGHIRIEFSDGKSIWFAVYGSRYIGIKHESVAIIKDCRF